MRNATLSNIFAALLIGALMFAFLAFAILRRDALIAVAALAFALALPVIGIGWYKMRRAAVRRFDETPIGYLNEMRHALAVDRSQLWSARACSTILTAATAASVGLAACGVVALQEVLFPAIAWLVTALVVWLWQSAREHSLTEEIKRVDALVDEFRAAES
jgi:hypothetical protein